MKILYVHNEKVNSEYANLIQVQAMCKAMANLGHKVVLSVPAGTKTDSGKTIQRNGYTLSLRKAFSSKLSQYLSGSEIRKAVNKHNPDLVYLRSPLILKAVARYHIAIIIELHNASMHLGKKFLDRYWTNYLIKVSQKNIVSKFVCISDALSQYWIGLGLPEKKVETHHDAIDHLMYENPLVKQEARKRVELPQDKMIVSYIGRLYENRGIGDILKLACELKALYFVVVGGPAERTEYFRSIASEKGLNNIVFTGQVPHSEVTLYQYASDVLLALWSKDVPAINYCSPLKLFEYMASGNTIVAHGFPTIKEVLKDEVNAIVIEPDSYEGLKEGVRKAINKQDNALGTQARRDVFEKYTWQKRAEDILRGI